MLCTVMRGCVRRRGTMIAQGVEKNAIAEAKKRDKDEDKDAGKVEIEVQDRTLL